MVDSFRYALDDVSKTLIKSQISPRIFRNLIKRDASSLTHALVGDHKDFVPFQTVFHTMDNHSHSFSCHNRRIDRQKLSKFNF